MQQTELLCNTHNLPITNICIENHSCSDRRLCNECLFERHLNTQKKYTPLIEEFMKRLTKKLNMLKERNYQQLIHKIDSFTNLPSELLEKCKITVDRMICQLQNTEFNYKLLRSKSILEFSQNEYEILVQMIIGNKVELSNICEVYYANCSLNISKFLNGFPQSVTQIVSEQCGRKIKIRGNQDFGMKNGDYYYENEDGTLYYAGKYEFGIKQGIWNDLLGYDKIKKQNVFSTVRYLNGIKMGLNDCYLKFYKQQFVKHGEWVEECGVWNQLISFGNYYKNNKVGNWYYFYNSQICAQGEFDVLGQKIWNWKEDFRYYGKYRKLTFCDSRNLGLNCGDWIELDSNFKDANSLTITGSHSNGLKHGQWQTLYKGIKIGGGIYDEDLKDNNWIDIDENFREYNNCQTSSCQVTHHGNYQRGVRVGLWETNYKGQIMGGIYEEGVKQGLWTEILDSFSDPCQLTFKGLYKNGLRQGEWIIEQNGQKIGGGFYNDNGLKSGQWTELYDYALKNDNHILITFQGEYRIGLKFGQWIILNSDKEIGGGQYNEKGVKTGKWTVTLSEFTHCGSYKNGQKSGLWQIFRNEKELYGGQFDENGVKRGKWVEMNEEFEFPQHLIESGEYKNGLRLGLWIQKYDKIFGKGCYDERGVKINEWIEIYLTNRIITIQSGKYKNGLRAGIWQISYQNNALVEQIEYEDGIKKN